jgi:hypothetical protein
MNSGNLKLTILVFASALLLSSVVMAERIDQGDIPEIQVDACDTSCQIKYVDVDTCWPGNTIDMPVHVLNKNPLTRIEFTLDCPAGFTFDSLNTTDSPWTGSIDIDTIGGFIYIDFIEDSDTLECSASFRRLADVKLKAGPSINFGTTRTVDFEEPPRARVTGSDTDCIVDSTFSGQITVPDDSVMVIIGPQTIYSYQGTATDDSCKNDYPVTIPISLYSNFPCSTYSLVIDKQLASWAFNDASFDTVYEAGCTFSPLVFGYFLKLSGKPVENMGNNYTLPLGNLKLKVHDFKSSYNADSSFSDTFYVSLKPNWSTHLTYVYNWGDDDSLTFPDDIHSDSAEMILPQYGIEFEALDAEVDPSGKVVVPITINPTFYAADYNIWVNYDFDFMTLDSIVAAGGHYPEIDTMLMITDNQARRKHYEIKSDSMFQEAKYFLPDSQQTAFNMHFTVEDTFTCSDTMTINFTPKHPDTIFVYDWFSANNSGSKIQRDYDDGEFWSATGGIVTEPPEFHVSVGGPTYYDNEVVRVEVNVEYVNVDSVTWCELIYTENTTEADSVKKGDWEFESVWFDPQWLCFEFGEEHGYPDTAGLLAYVWITWSDTGRFEIVEGEDSYVQFPGGYIEVQFVGDPLDYKWQQPKLAAGLPDAFSLSQNYPNPFNAQTNISLNMASPGFAELKVFDILGRQINTLVSEELPAGKHIINWDGANVAGKPPFISEFCRVLFYRRTVSAGLRTGAAVFKVVDSVGDIQTVIITTGVDISAIMPSGARGAIRIA